MHFDLSQCMRWAAQLRFEDLPPAVVESAKHQAISMLAAVLHGYRSEQGLMIARAFGIDIARDPDAPAATLFSGDRARAVFLLSSWSMVHDYDDVMLGGHTGHSSVIVPYVLALAHGGSGRDVLLAQVVANEVSARLNIACALGETRGQMASYLHLIAASIARAKYEKQGPEQMQMTLAFALAAPSKLSLPGFLGGDTKFFCAAGAIRAGWEAVDCVNAGLRANPETVVGGHGFIGTHAVAAHRELFEDFGLRWYTTTNSFKAYPACGYISSSIDAALAILHEHRIDPEQIDRVDIEASMFTFGVERLTRPYLDGENTSVATLTFSPAFAVASTLVHREFTPRNLERERLRDPRVWALLDRVCVRHARRHTRTALFDGIPTGMMLSLSRWAQVKPFLRKFNRTVFGRRNRFLAAIRDADLAWQWYRSRRKGLPDFADLTKSMGSTVRVGIKGGGDISASRVIPTGFTGDCTPDQALEMLRFKYLDAAAGLGESQARVRMSLLERLDTATSDDLVRYNFICKETLP